MHDRGEPADLQRREVRQLGDCYDWVNVFVGADAASAKVAHRFFLEADGDEELTRE